MSRIWYNEEDGNVKTIYHYTLLLDVIDYFVNKRLVLSCNWGKFKSRMTANIYLRKKKKGSKSSVSYHQALSSVVRGPVPNLSAMHSFGTPYLVYLSCADPL